MRADSEADVGVIRPDETDSFLQVMCEAFDMEFEAAKPIFYSDPYFNANNKYVLRIGGEIVSCLTVVDRECRLGDALVRVAGIAGVATRPPFRRRGLAGTLLCATLRALAARGFHLAALFPTDPDYYRRFGWETGGTERKARKIGSRSPFEDAGANCHVRKVSTADIGALSEIYDRCAEGRTMYCSRDEKRWRYLLAYLGDSLVAVADGRAHGYVLCTYRPSGPADPCSGHIENSVRILEMFAKNAAARSALWRRITGPPPPSSIEFTSTQDVLDENGFAVPEMTLPSFMVRIVDWPSLLDVLATNWKDVEGELGMALVDPILAAKPQASIVRFANGRTSVESVDPAELAVKCRNVVVGEIGAWSATAVGHTCGADACAAGLLKASNADAMELMSRLFPARDPFIPAADHF